MKKITLIVLIIAICFTQSSYVYSEDVFKLREVNPEFQRYLDNPEEFSGYIPSPVVIKQSENSGMRFAQVGILPPVFDSRISRNLPPVRHQGTEGNCWAFSSLAALETPLYNLIPQQAVDYSEAHMAQTLGDTPGEPWSYDREANEGGNSVMAWAYFTRWSGPVAESDAPYNFPITSRYLPVQKHVQDIIVVPQPNSEDYYTKDVDYRNNVKRLVYDYGAVSTHYGHYDTAFNYTYNSYFYNGHALPNHAVAIVGWDDNFSKTKFKTQPMGDGAWICRNSWSEAFGDDGYFYVSYYDKYIGMESFAIPAPESGDNYDNIYMYDPLGQTGQIPLPDLNVIWGANKFARKSENETLDAVGVYVTGENVNCKVYVDTNAVGAGAKNFTDNSYVAEQNFAMPGYYTIKLPSPIALTGETFTTAVKFTHASASSSIAIEHSIAGFSTKAVSKPDQGFVKATSDNSWTDVTGINNTASVCIKAYTSNIDMPYKINAVLGYNKVSVDISELNDEPKATAGYLFTAYIGADGQCLSVELDQVALPMAAKDFTYPAGTKYVRSILLEDDQTISPLAYKSELKID